MRHILGVLLALALYAPSHVECIASGVHTEAVHAALVSQVTTRVLSQAVSETKTPQRPCPALSKEVLASKAVNGVVLITVVDHLVMKKFGESFIQNVVRTNISYWFVAALDPWTSLHLGSMEPKFSEHCFNAPHDKLRYKGAATGYAWGSHHWKETTWNKVHVLAAVYALGFHVIHSDTDTTWFNDPMPYFSNFLNGPVHAIFSTDSLATRNPSMDKGLEVETHPHVNINTGVYFVRQYPEGNDFFQVWISFQDIINGHDQDGLNSVVRGEAHTGDKKLNKPSMDGTLIVAAQHKITRVSLLPVSMFGNAYTFGIGRVHERVSHPLYEVHWVWSGSTMESKQQNIRDAGKFWDPPEYYGVGDPTLQLVSVGPLWVPDMPANFNGMRFEETELMIRFHLIAANAQLHQAYFAFVAAMALNRTLILPKFSCFCAKNWYMTQQCRINGEWHTQFPFPCGLSQLMRAKKLITRGLEVEDGTKVRTTHIREYRFLDHYNLPDEIKNSRLELLPAGTERSLGSKLDLSQLIAPTKLADGSTQQLVPWPLNDADLKAILKTLPNFRHIHFANATMIMSKGFQDNILHKNFDVALQKLVTYWCCRSPADMKGLNMSAKVQLNIVPPSRGGIDLVTMSPVTARGLLAMDDWTSHNDRERFLSSV